MYIKKFNFKNCKFYNKYTIYDFKLLKNFVIVRCVRLIQSSQDIGNVKFSFAVEIA
jgi:hypothetical protein